MAYTAPQKNTSLSITYNWPNETISHVLIPVTISRRISASFSGTYPQVAQIKPFFWNP